MNYARMTKAELICELKRLQTQMDTYHGQNSAHTADYKNYPDFARQKIQSEQTKHPLPSNDPVTLHSAAGPHISNLIHQEHIARNIMEVMPEAVALFDFEGRILHANQQFLTSSGFQLREVVGKTAFQLGVIGEQELSVIQTQVLPELMEKGKVRNVNFTVRNQKGELHPVLMSWTLLHNQQGYPEAVINVARDISELVEAERKLKDYQQNLQSLASELTLTEQRERRRIATELHDQVGQNLAFSLLKLQHLSQHSSGTTLDELAEIEGWIDVAIQNIRALIFNLDSPILKKGDLLEAIDEWAQANIVRHHGLKCIVQDDGLSKPLDEDMRYLLFESARELLVNVVKHARADIIIVDASLYHDSFKLTISDNGIGYVSSSNDDNSQNGGGFGLFSIQERIKYVKGTFAINGKKGRGTVVTLTAPLSKTG